LYSATITYIFIFCLDCRDMVFIYICFLAIAFATTLDKEKAENQALRQTHAALVKALKQLERSSAQEASVADTTTNAAYGKCYNKCHDEGGSLDECDQKCSTGNEVTVAQNADCYNRCRQNGGDFTECSNDCGYTEEQVGGAAGCSLADGQPQAFAFICEQQKEASCLSIGVCKYTSKNGQVKNYEKPICRDHTGFAGDNQNEEWCDLNSRWMSKCTGCKYGYFWGGTFNLYTYCCKPADLTKSCYCA